MAGYTTGQRQQINYKAKRTYVSLRQRLNLYRQSRTDYARRQQRRHVETLLGESDRILRDAEAVGLAGGDVSNLRAKDTEARRVLGKPARAQATSPGAAVGTGVLNLIGLGVKKPAAFKPAIIDSVPGVKKPVPVKWIKPAAGKKPVKLMPGKLPGIAKKPVDLTTLMAVLNRQRDLLLSYVAGGRQPAAQAEQTLTNSLNTRGAALVAQDYAGASAWLQDAIDAFYQAEASLQQGAPQAAPQDAYAPQYADQAPQQAEPGAEPEIDYTYEDGTPASAEDVAVAQGQFAYDDSADAKPAASYGPYGTMTSEETDSANLEAQAEFDRAMEGLGTFPSGGALGPSAVLGTVGALFGYIAADKNEQTMYAVGGGLAGVVVGFILNRRLGGA